MEMFSICSYHLHISRETSNTGELKDRQTDRSRAIPVHRGPLGPTDPLGLLSSQKTAPSDIMNAINKRTPLLLYLHGFKLNLLKMALVSSRHNFSSQ